MKKTAKIPFWHLYFKNKVNFVIRNRFHSLLVIIILWLTAGRYSFVFPRAFQSYEKFLEQLHTVI